MKEKYLPIGTICKTDVDKTLMIIGYLPVKPDNGYFDYSGCLYPQGVLAPETILGFNHEDITEIVSAGYENEEYKEFNEFVKGIDLEKISTSPEQLIEEKVEEQLEEKLEENVEQL